jgi:hypothetical protein
MTAYGQYSAAVVICHCDGGRSTEDRQRLNAWPGCLQANNAGVVHSCRAQCGISLGILPARRCRRGKVLVDSLILLNTTTPLGRLLIWNTWGSACTLRGELL